MADAAIQEAKQTALKELGSKQNDQMSKLQFTQESKSMRANVADGSRDSQADVERAISREARSGLDAAKRSIGSSDANEQARGWAAAKLYADAIVDSQNRLVKLAQQEAQEREKSGEKSLQTIEKELELKQKAFGKLGEDRDQAQERFAKLDPIQRRQALDGLSKSQRGIDLDQNELEAVEKLGTRESKQAARNQYAKTASQSGFDQIDQGFQRERQQLERETRPLQNALVQQQATYNITLADNSAVKDEMLKAALKIANERARIDMAELQARFDADRKKTNAQFQGVADGQNMRKNYGK